MAVEVMHCLAMKLCTVLRRAFTSRRKRSVVALAIVEVMIDMPVEMLPPVIPRPSTDKDTAWEPFGAVIAVWSAIVRRSLVIPVRANGRHSDANPHLRSRVVNGSYKKTHSNCRQA